VYNYKCKEEIGSSIRPKGDVIMNINYVMNKADNDYNSFADSYSDFLKIRRFLHKKGWKIKNNYIRDFTSIHCSWEKSHSATIEYIKSNGTSYYLTYAITYSIA